MALVPDVGDDPNIEDRAHSGIEDRENRRENRDRYREALGDVVNLGVGNQKLGIGLFVGGKCSQDIISWLQEYEIRSRAHNWDDSARFRKLPLYLGEVARDWFYVYVSCGGENAPKNWSELKNLMRAHFLPSDYKTYLRGELNCRIQKQGESAADYAISKHALCLKLDEDMVENEIMERVIEGLNPEVAQSIYVQDPEDFECLLDLIKKIERGRNVGRSSYRNVEELGEDKRVLVDMQRGMTQLTKTVSDLAKSLSELKSGDSSSQFRSRDFNNRLKCFSCGREGHVARFCRQGNRQLEQGTNNRNFSDRGNNPGNRYSSSADRNLSSANAHRVRAQWELGELIEIPAKISGIEVSACIDTGSVITMVSEEVIKGSHISVSPYSGPRIMAGSGDPYQAVGQTLSEIEVRNSKNELLVVEINVMVVKDFPFELLLGNDFNIKAGTNVKFVKGNRSVDFTSSSSDLRETSSPKVSVHNKELLVIPARTTAWARVSLANKEMKKSSFGVVSACNKIYKKQRLIVANAVAQFDLGEAELEITNFSLRQRKVLPGAILGEFNELCMYDKYEGNFRPYSCTSLTSKEIENVIPEDRIILELSKGKVEVGSNLREFELNKMKAVLEKYIDCLAFDKTNLGKCDVAKHYIPAEGEPLRCAPYRYSLEKREEIAKQVTEMIELDVVRPSKSPWSSPVVLVRKKDGSFRFCVDYRKLNSITKSDVYPLPNIDDALSSFNGARFFSTLDCNSGYWQIEIDEKDREKSAFITQDGLYEFKAMPFGLKNAPSCFQRVMDVVLAGLKWGDCLVYLDDVIVFGSSLDEMIVRLSSVFERFITYGLTLKASKCIFGADRVLFLGHTIDREGIKLDPAKVSAITEFSRPNKLRELRSFLGLCSYYRKFVSHFSTIVKPLTILTKKDQKFVWGSDQERAFELIKSELSSYPVLAHFDSKKDVKIRTDASGYGLGAAILQKEGNVFKPIAYASRMLNESELNYTISEKECLAVVYAVEKFEQFLSSKHFEIESDHCALCWLSSKSKLPKRLHRYSLILQEYNYTIKYRSGSSHKDVDCLSRYPVDPPSEGDKLSDKLALVNIEFDNDLMSSQRSDIRFSKILESINDSSDLNSNPEYFINSGVLMKRVQIGGNEFDVICIPEKLRDSVLYALHDDMSSGHLGYKKTFEKLAKRYYWDGMRDYCEKYVKSCVDCQTKKPGTLVKSGFLNPIKVGSPFEMVGVDIVGPFPRSNSGKLYIIVAVDYMTKYAITKPIRKANAMEVSKFFVNEIVSKHGAPTKILSDRGTPFLSKVSSSVFSLMGTKHLKTTAYKPSTNGLTERMNKTIVNMISMYVSSSQKDWDQILPFVTFAYNSSIQESSKYTPFYLVHGREAVLPSDVVMGVQTNKALEENAYVQMISSSLAKARDQARLNILNSGLKNAKYFNRDRKEISFEVGDKVLILRPTIAVGKSKKFLNKFKGPYEVVEKSSPLNYKIKKVGGRSHETVHVSKMKHFCEMTRDYIDHENIELGQIESELNASESEIEVRESEIETSESEIEVSDSEIEVSDSEVGGSESNSENECFRKSYRVKRKPDRLGY